MEYLKKKVAAVPSHPIGGDLRQAHVFTYTS